jgi:cyclophilin family peptidyl-prolyl cis-trans isomerase
VKARSRHALWLGLAAALSIGGCGKGGSTGPGDAGTDAGAKAPADPSAERIAAILRAEHRRVAAEITPADQQSRAVTVRRAAARALARIGGDEARPGLVRALSDEDREVVAWAAYGLGFSCAGHEKETVAALVARSLSLESDTPSGAKAEAKPRFDARLAIARAIGRCAAEESEPTLVAWLSGPQDAASAAALGLGDLATVKQRLREETLAALLHLAAGSASSPPAPEGLFPIARLPSVPTTVTARLREVATARLSEPGERRLFAVRALGRAGEEATAELARVLASPGVFIAAERAEAARALGTMGEAGQRALAEALPALAPSADPVQLATLVGEDLGVLLRVLDLLKEPGRARKTLRELAALPAPQGAPMSLLRRVSWIRCDAASIVAGADVRDPLLVACDLTGAPPAPTESADAGAPPPPPEGQPGSIGARALVKVLGRASITGPRLGVFRLHVRPGADVRAREAALELFLDHEEIEAEASATLAEALGAREPGVAATAAEVISKKPQLAAEAPKRKKRGKRKRDEDAKDAKADEEAAPALPPSPAIVKALKDMLARADAEDDPELLGAAIDAAAALALKDTQPRLEELCRSSYPAIRKHASQALGLVSGKTPTCTAPPGGGPVPPELDAVPAGEVKLTLDTDAGQMVLALDPGVAPVAVARIVALARAGYYDNMVVHRVDAGFVTQLGAPFGDGYGGPPGKAPLRCETSPLPFEPLSIGIALAGRDTGSSQFFVTHGRFPHLDGQYAWIGKATGPWAAFVDGDLVRKVTVSQ